MRAIAILLVGCSAPAGLEVTPEEAPPEPVAAAEESTGESEPPRDPCYVVSDAVLSRWPDAGEQLENAGARWFRWFRPADPGEACDLNIIAVDSAMGITDGGRCSIACTESWFIGLRIDEPKLVSGASCEKPELLLTDVLTHELGHWLGLEHSESGAMGPHAACTPVVPTDEEIHMVSPVR